MFGRIFIRFSIGRSGPICFELNLKDIFSEGDEEMGIILNSSDYPYVSLKMEFQESVRASPTEILFVQQSLQWLKLVYGFASKGMVKSHMAFKSCVVGIP